MELAQPAMTTMNVQCPDGVGPGSMIQVTSPSGQVLQLQVPEGVQPGMQFQCQVPAPPPMPVAVAQAMPMPVAQAQMPVAQGMQMDQRQMPVAQAQGMPVPQGLAPLAMGQSTKDGGMGGMMGKAQGMFDQLNAGFEKAMGDGPGGPSAAVGVYPSQQMPGQPGMVQAPGQQGMQGRQFASPYDDLNAMPRILVAEKANMVQALTAVIGVEIDMANKYRVLDEQEQEHFFVVEETNWLIRNLKRGACSDCVGWDASVLYTYAGANQPFLKMHRDHTLTFCCFNRPIVDVTDSNSGQKIGSIRDPWACCDLTFQLLDPSGADVLLAKGGCCQCGLCCPLPCGPCSTVHFDIVDARSGQTVGSMDKKVPNLIKWLIPGATTDNYEIDFQGIQHPQWKAMVMILAVFIDFRYFSETQDPNDVGNDGMIGMMMD